MNIKHFIETQPCPYCEKPITNETLIKEPNEFFTTQQVKTFCPHCHGQVEKSISIKYLMIGLFLLFIISFGQGWLRELHIINEGWLRALGALLNFFVAFPIAMLSFIKSPYVRSKNTA